VKTVYATRYVTPLREGGSLPAIVEGDDDGLYVAKFRGAGQGEKALVAELIAGELARAAGLRVPELVLLEVDAALGRNEPDPEIRELLNRSVGVNVGLDYLPGSVSFDPAVGPPPKADEASEIVWFDALVANLDRSAKNTNLLLWHRQLWLIDHGAALYFHHAWTEDPDPALSPFGAVKTHVLLPWASEIAAAGERLGSLLSREVIADVVSEVPDALLVDGSGSRDRAARRAAYVAHFTRRLDAARVFVEEAERARADLV
jgi:hypothetical protein